MSETQRNNREKNTHYPEVARGIQEATSIDEVAKKETQHEKNETNNHGSKEQLESLHSAIENIANSSEAMRTETRPEKESTHQHPVFVSHHLKSMAYSRSLTRMRKQLPLIARPFSKFVHLAPIDKTSELVGKTVARPISLFWGALFACVGSSLLLWTTRHYGYEYNYLALFILFGGGIIIGLCLELLWQVVKRKR